MSCRTFQRWLDAGMPALAAREAERHAAACPSCANALEAALAMEPALRASPSAPAPAGFADRVMSQVAVEGRTARATPLRRSRALRPTMPWWFESVAHPLVAGALILAGLLLGLRAEVWGLATAIAAWLTAPPRTTALETLARPEVATAIALALLPLALMAAWTCRRTTERLVLVRRRSRRRRAGGSRRGAER